MVLRFLNLGVCAPCVWFYQQSQFQSKFDPSNFVAVSILPRLNQSTFPEGEDGVPMGTDTPNHAKFESPLESPGVSVQGGLSAPCMVSPDAWSGGDGVALGLALSLFLS